MGKLVVASYSIAIEGEEHELSICIHLPMEWHELDCWLQISSSGVKKHSVYTLDMQYITQIVVTIISYHNIIDNTSIFFTVELIVLQNAWSLITHRVFL